MTERLLEKDGVPVRIGGRALDILILLVERPGKVVDKRELLAKVWADVTVVEGSLRLHARALRKALGDEVAGARYVKNVPAHLSVPLATFLHATTESHDYRITKRVPPAQVGVATLWQR